MHELSSARPSSGVVDDVVRDRRSGRKRTKKIWIGQVETDTAAAATTRRTPLPPRIDPRLEAARAITARKLGKRLIALCAPERPPALAIERWIFDAQVDASLTSPTRTRESFDDPVFGPMFRLTGDELKKSSIVDDLLRASVSNALNVAKRLQLETKTIMTTQRQKLTASSRSKRVEITHHRHTIDVSINASRLLKLNHNHYSKLKALWRGGRGGGDDTVLFHDDLYVLLARYFTIQGHGFQAACPETVFDTLHRELSVSFECFASPLNCYFGRYCSAFPDIDARFGSEGSFWSWVPPSVGGSFQANPPFVAKTMKRMADKIVNLLDTFSQPLSFVVVVPVWLEDDAYTFMSASPHKRAHWVVSKAEHGFCDGAQHQRRDRFRESPYDTAVFVLQNSKGSTKWLVTPSVERAIRRSFACGVPSAQAIARRKREGRGFADADGGGGVYKGKRRRSKEMGVEVRRRRERKRKKRGSLISKEPNGD